jgi:hypothetical protein
MMWESDNLFFYLKLKWFSIVLLNPKTFSSLNGKPTTCIPTGSPALFVALTFEALENSSFHLD